MIKLTNTKAKRLGTDEMSTAYKELEKRLLAVTEEQDFKGILDTITPLHQKDKDNLLPVFSAMSISFRKAKIASNGEAIDMNAVYNNAKKHIATKIMEAIIEKNAYKQEHYTEINKNKSLCAKIAEDILGIKKEQDFAEIIANGEKISNQGLRKDIARLITFTRVHLFVDGGKGKGIDPARALQKANRNLEKTHYHQTMKKKNAVVVQSAPKKSSLVGKVMGIFKRNSQNQHQ